MLAEIKEAYSSKELARLEGVAVSTIVRRAESEGWQSRPKAGRGGGNEWLVSSMPKGRREHIMKELLSRRDPGEAAPSPDPDNLTNLVARDGTRLSQITERQRRTMEARLVFVREVEKLAGVAGKETAVRNLVEAAKTGQLSPHLQYLVRVANDRSGKRDDRGLSYQSIYRWCSQYAADGPAGLVPLHRQRDMSVPPWADAFLSLYQTWQKPSVADCLRRMEWEGKKPSIHTVYRFLKKMGVPTRQAGRVTGNALLQLRPHKMRTTDNLLPGDVYTADGTTLDAEIQNPLNGQPFKPEITIILDVATRRAVGVSVGLSESGLTILDALRMACCFGGVPALFYCDNGSGYKNQLMRAEGQGMMARLGIEMTNSIPGRPQGKGLMERGVQTICTPLAKRLPSCTHKDVDRDAAQKVYKITRKDLKSKGHSALLPTWPEFLKHLLARIEEYNSTEHKKLPLIEEGGKRRHMTPDEMWQDFETKGWESCRVPPEYAEELFMPGERRKVRNGVVRLFNGEYFSVELEEFHQDIVEVRYDIWDSSKVYVWTTQGEKICEAELNAHSTPYFPENQVAAARERRKKGQVARLSRKLEEVAPGVRVELPDNQAYEAFTVADSVQPEAVAEAAEALDLADARQQVVKIETRPNFQFAHEKYEWLMRHPEQRSEADYAWLCQYAQSEEYADLHDHYVSLGIAWQAESIACGGES